MTSSESPLPDYDIALQSALDSAHCRWVMSKQSILPARSGGCLPSPSGPIVTCRRSIVQMDGYAVRGG